MRQGRINGMRGMLLGGLIVFSASALLMGARLDDGQWAAWRGPGATGVSSGQATPSTWSATENIQWKAAIPGQGSSTPIIWGDRVFLTTAIKASPGDGDDAQAPPQPAAEGRRGRRGGGGGFGRGPAKIDQRFVVLALDAKTGKVVWERTVREGMPASGTHPDGTYASHSPVTDGERLYAYFGSQGLYCMDLNGKVLWEQDFVDMNKRREFGEGSSPTLYGDRLIITCDHEGDSFITAFDKHTGKQLWKTERDEPSSWATPQVVEVGGKAQIVTPGANATRGYDLESGELIWTGPGLTLNAIPSPVIEDGVAYVMAGFRGSSVLAIKLDRASGKFGADSNAIVWSYGSNTPYVPSPVLHDGRLYFLSVNSSLLTCLDAASGKVHYTQRIEGIGNIYSSPVAAGGLIYITSREGRTAVIRAGDDYELVGMNDIGEGVDASPAIVDGAIIMRGSEHLYRIDAD